MLELEVTSLGNEGSGSFEDPLKLSHRINAIVQHWELSYGSFQVPPRPHAEQGAGGSFKGPHGSIGRNGTAQGAKTEATAINRCLQDPTLRGEQLFLETPPWVGALQGLERGPIFKGFQAWPLTRTEHSRGKNKGSVVSRTPPPSLLVRINSIVCGRA